MEGVHLGAIAALKEGVLRQNAKGRWGVEQSDGSIVWLDDLLTPYRNKDVRVMCVDLKEAAHYAKTLGRHNG